MKHLKKVIINNFWKQGNIIWELQSDVNVLVGINGSGKTAILNMIKEALNPKDNSELNFKLFSPFCEDMKLVFTNNETISIESNSNYREINDSVKNDILKETPVDLVTTFNPPIKKRRDRNDDEQGAKTALDENLEDYVLLFDSYKKEIDIEITSAIRHTTDKKIIVDLLTELYADIDNLYRLIDVFFGETGKSINSKKEPFYFLPLDIKYTELSSGEKQLLILFLATFLQRKKESILLLDEPEISLHSSWQRKLINTLREINPLCQLIIVTHSASLYGNDWIAYRSKMEKEGEGSIWEQKQEILPLQTNEIQPIIIQEQPKEVKKLTEELKAELQNRIENYGNNAFDKTFHINLRLKQEESFSFEACKEILELMQKKNVKPDQITLGTMIGRIDSFENGKKLIQLCNRDFRDKKKLLIPFPPNEIALNQLLKKENDFEKSMNFVKETKYENIDFPDIVTFSTLLGKIRTAEPAKKVDELRNYLGVVANPQYLVKLRSLLRQA